MKIRRENGDKIVWINCIPSSISGPGMDRDSCRGLKPLTVSASRASTQSARRRWQAASMARLRCTAESRGCPQDGLQQSYCHCRPFLPSVLYRYRDRAGRSVWRPACDAETPQGDALRHKACVQTGNVAFFCNGIIRLEKRANIRCSFAVLYDVLLQSDQWRDIFEID